MPLINQQDGLDFYIEPDFSEPPYVRITKENGFVLIQIGIPEKELPYILESENAAQEDIDRAFQIVWVAQEKFLNLAYL